MNTIYTLGYASWQLDEVIRAVHDRGAILVDVRLSPRSAKPGFNSTKLGQRLAEAYMHVPAFGNLNYASGGPITLKNPQQGIRQVAPLLVHWPVILMCGCKNVATCHRSVVADLLHKETGTPAVHIEKP